jgi:hypothetical protein
VLEVRFPNLAGNGFRPVLAQRDRVPSMAEQRCDRSKAQRMRSKRSLVIGKRSAKFLKFGFQIWLGNGFRAVLVRRDRGRSVAEQRFCRNTV